jgi:predicted 2-oxoglutarate/Fe(II)-dependent dioxygenase YbiX
VFLNGSDAGEPAGYSGGSLTFYGLMDDGAGGESVGLPLAGELGLLVAFPSDLLHSVSPVTAGERYTLVTWFFEGAGDLSVSESAERLRGDAGSA